MTPVYAPGKRWQSATSSAYVVLFHLSIVAREMKGQVCTRYRDMCSCVPFLCHAISRYPIIRDRRYQVRGQKEQRWNVCNMQCTSYETDLLQAVMRSGPCVDRFKRECRVSGFRICQRHAIMCSGVSSSASRQSLNPRN